MASTKSIVEGTTPVIDLTFRDPDDELENPSTITAIHRDPDGVEVSYTQADPEISLLSLGKWRLILPPAARGAHTVHVVGVGASTTVTKTIRFTVRADGVETT
jgi:hypothetical protein